MILPWRLAFGLMIAVLAQSGPVFAVEGDDSGVLRLDQDSKGAQQPKTLEERLDELEKRQAISDRLRELFQEREEQRIKEDPVLEVGRDGFLLRSRDRDFELRIRGYMQFDSRFYLADNKPSTTNTFDVRRARPVFQGTLYRYFDYYIMPDFGQGQVILFDAYGGLNIWDQLRLRIGKYRPPMSVEMLQSAADTLFVERSVALNLVPNRDIGIQLYGDLFDNRLGYQVGIFNGVADNTTNGGSPPDFDQNNAKDYIGRLFARPLGGSNQDWIEGLQIGVAGSAGQQLGILDSYRIPGQGSDGITFFTYRSGAQANGARYRLNPQMYYSWGPFGLLAEYVYHWQRVQAAPAQGGRVEVLNDRAWNAEVSYVLTGEKASYTGVRPWQTFNPSKGTWGAVEVKARYNELRVDPNSFPVFADPSASARKVRAWAVGVNWYFAYRIKAMLDYEQGIFDGGAPRNGNLEREHLILTRFQIAW
ncbi:MAG TPA: porin [Nitrospira sp.]|nr:porin [Nitrospira sp.]